jgi:hypothetical protein
MIIRCLLALSVGVLLSGPGAFGQVCNDQEIVRAPDVSRYVKKNYLEIVYDVKTGRLDWHQHPDKKPPAPGTPSNGIIAIPQTALFPPFTDTKQRILVKVCNLRFESDVSATTTVTNIPESGPDIHGLEQASTAATPQVASAQSLKALFAATITTPPTPADISTTLALPNGVALVKLQLESLMAAYELDFRPLAYSIRTFQCHQDVPENECDVGTVRYIRGISVTLSQDVEERGAAADATSNEGAFELLASRTQALIVSLNNLQSALQSADLATKIGKVLADDQSLASQLGSIEQFLAKEQKDFDDAQAKVTDSEKAVEAAQAALNKASARDKAQKETELQQRTNELNIANQALAKETPTHNRYGPLRELAGTLEDESKTLHPFSLVDQIIELDGEVAALHHNASDVFKGMNALHKNSNVVMAKVLDPVTTNAVISVAIILHDNYAPFDFAVAKSSNSDNSGAQAPGTSSNPSDVKSPSAGNNNGGSTKSPSPQSGSQSGTEQHVVRTILVEVHRISDFNIVSGFAASSIQNPAYGLRAISSTNTNLVAFQSQNDRLQGQYLIGINAYLCKRDTFPGYLTQKMRWIPGVLMGTSVSSSRVNFVTGLDLEPLSGIDFYGGAIFGEQTELGSGIVLGVTQFPTTTTTVPTTQKFAAGAFFGVGLDAHVFTSIFKKTF